MAGLTLNPGEKDLRRIVDVIRQLMEGRSNAIGTFTLTAGATSTTVKAPTCSPSSIVLVSPQTQDAANDGATSSYAPAYGQFVVTHANNARVDRTFGFLVIG
jgi:hypothetical protein